MTLIPDINNSTDSKKIPQATSQNLKAKKQKKIRIKKQKNSGELVQDIKAPKKSLRSRKTKVGKEVKAVKKIVVKSKRKKRIKIILSISVLLIFILSALGAQAYSQGKVLYEEAIAGKDDFVAAQQNLTDQNFKVAINDLSSAQEHLVLAQEASDNLFWMKWVPGVSTQFKAVDNLLVGGIKIAGALVEISYVADDIFSVVESEEVTVSSITQKERKQILQTIEDSPDRLQSAQDDLAEALIAMESIPTEGVISILDVAIIPLREKLPLVEQIVDKALPFLDIAPTILGYPDEKTYLFILQNNTELRPTGGFIGTYGILILKNADIQEFKTDNIYNLDVPVKDELFVTPPEPFHTYLGSTQWFMRDANWDPDFPTTAKKVEEFYHLENGPVENLDGVISVTPKLIEQMLMVTGPITVEGEEYTEENLTEKLQYQVEIGYRQEGATDSERKAVIGTLASELMSKMMNLPKSQWRDLWSMLMDNLDEKHVMIYSKDSKAQKLIEELDWAGSIEEHEGDYVMVIDANLAALKTDRVMTKNIDYAVSQQGEDVIVDMALRYYNDGVFDFFTTRYRTYTRIYVPTGSELIETNGFLTTDRFLGGQPVAAKVTQDEEKNKTIFEGFISVEPKTEEVVTLKYKLPRNIVDAINDNKYGLFMQKQPGTDNVSFNFSFDVGKKIDVYKPIDEIEQIGNNELHFSSQLNTDKEINIDFR
ncbi:MAG: DUF4012 domain-containing protein [bacterium]|nr:DUF4012 domain-containing protein [bacterium]